MSTFKKVLVGALALVAFAASSADAATYTWTKTLKLGSKNAHVMDLQKFLNMCPATAVATTGAGSAGHETKTFGPATKAAVMKFQTANGIKASGVFGALSRAKAAALQASGNPCGSSSVSTTPSNTTLPAGCTSTSGFSPLTGVSCASGTSSTSTTSSSGVNVSLASDNPGAGSIVAGQALADLAHFTFSGNGTVSSVTLQRTGFSTNTTLQNVYLYNGVQRLTDAASVNSNGVIVFNNLNLSVSSATKISVMADIDSGATSGQTAGVTLTGYTVGSGSMMTVSFPGNIMTIANGTNVLATASLGTQTVASGATVNAGSPQYSLFSAPLQVNLHAAWLKGVRFMYVGSASNNSLANIKLYMDGSPIATSNGVMTDNSGTYAMFDLSGNPFSVSTGSHTLEVRADINGGSNRTVQMTIQNKADLLMSDVQNMVNIGVTGIPVVSPATININAGSATITIDPNFSALSNVTGGAANAVIGKFVVNGYGENVKVTSLSVTPTLTGTTPTGTSLNNVALYFNGSQVGSSQNFTGTALTFNLGSSLIIPANSASSLEVHADIQNSTNQNYTAGTLAVSVNAGSSNAQGLSSLSTVSFPASAVTTNGLTIQTGMLAVSKNPAYVNQSVSPNTAATKIGSYVLQNQSSSESVRVTNLAVVVTPTFAALTSPITNLANLRTSETSGSGSVAINPQTGTNNFSVNFQLAPGATKTIDVLADVSTATGSVTTTLLPTAMGVSSNVVVTPGSAIAGQTITVGVATFGTPTIVSSTTTPSQYVAVGTASGVSNATKASYNFTSTGGTATISELKFTVTASAGASDVTSITVNGTSAPVVAGVAYLTGLNIAVPNNAGGINVDAFASYGPAGASGVASGSVNTVALTSVKYTSGGTTTTITPSVSANAITIVGSQPMVAVNGVQQTGLILGSESKIGEVTVSANAAGNIKVNTLVFNLGSSGFGSGPTFSTARIADGSTTISGSSCALSGTTATCTLGTSPNGYLISAGTSKTFSLFATVNGTAASGSKASVSAQVSQTGLNWDDVAGGATGLNGALIYNFPTQSYSVSQ